MVRASDGNRVRATSASDAINKKVLVFLINGNGSDLPMHSATSPIHNPINCLLTKKSELPNISSAYTELAEYTNKQPINIRVVMIIRKTRKSAYKGNFFEII